MQLAPEQYRSTYTGFVGFFFFFFGHLWDPSSKTRGEIAPLHWNSRNLKHWTAMESATREAFFFPKKICTTGSEVRRLLEYGTSDTGRQTVVTFEMPTA